MNSNNPQILALIENYKSYISKTKMQDEVYKWELVKKFKGRPDTTATDFAAEYKAIKFGNLLYQLGSAVGNHICKENPEEFRQLFVYLFDETIPLNKRVSYFNSESLKIYRSMGETLGHHQDERSISTYLTLHNPEKYTFYKSTFYKEFCKLLGVAPAGKNEKYGHYLELINQFIENYIVPDAELTNAVKSYLPEYYDGKNNMLLAQDILYCMLNKKVENNINVMENLKEAFAKWLTTNPKADYFDNDKSKLVKELTTYEDYFDFPLYETSDKEYNNLIEGINEVIYATSNDFVVFSEKTSSHRPRAILGKRNYQRFLEELFRPQVPKNDIMNYPLNQILYGPPGTGKTFKLKDQYFPKYTTKETSLSAEQHFKNVVSECSWWQVIAIALIQTGKTKVSDLANHKWVLQKAQLSNSSTLRPTIWGQLQSHTVDECEFVNVKSKQQPFIFNKTEDSYWEILEEEVKEKVPELYEIIDSVENFHPSSDKEIQRYVFTTFHQSYSYEDFIEGIKPIMIDGEEDGNVAYHIEDGVFKQLCKKAEMDPENRYAIFIDEINRGNVSAIFGELITLIEQDKRKGAANVMSALLPYSKKQFSVPQNVDIYGTMNTADRSVEALDTALRRRFSFEEMLPKPELLKDKGENGSGQVGEINLEELLMTINERIEALVDRDHTIGHAFFMEVDSLDSLRNVFANKVIPLLQEYFYGDYAKMEMVIGPDFFNIEKRKKKVIFAIQNEDVEIPTGSYELMNVLDQNFQFEEALIRLISSK